MIGDGIRRIVTEEVESAIAKIDDDDLARDDAVHEVRKHCKKIRGALRLVRCSFDGYGNENERVRDLARNLSALRDARVLRDTQRDLMHDVAYSAGESEVDALNQALAAHAGDDPSGTDAALGAARNDLVAVAADVAAWEFSADEFAALSGGLRKTYRRARKAQRRCHGTDDALHEWRKRVKYHWYHLRLLVYAWPRVIKARQVAAHHLSGLLGDDHDLAAYLEVLDAPDADAPKKLAKNLRQHVALQRRLLQQESFAIGARLFAEKPKHLVRRFGTYYAVWRRPEMIRGGHAGKPRASRDCRSD